jgi:methanogenic corrinoid protein MtbC1
MRVSISIVIIQFTKKKTTFELTEEYFRKKIENYNIYDTNAGRPIIGNVTMNDFNYFPNSLVNAKCHICHSGFISSNKPTLNQKNNKIGQQTRACNNTCH